MTTTAMVVMNVTNKRATAVLCSYALPAHLSPFHEPTSEQQALLVGREEGSRNPLAHRSVYDSYYSCACEG
jgi:hypothetical protein